MGITIIGVVLGSIIAILVTIFIENLRKPSLKLEIDPPVDLVFQNQPANLMRVVRLKVRNNPLPSWAKWMSRNAALQCHGNITFHHLDGQNVFGRSMPIRWASSPEPIPMTVQLGNTKGLIFDPSRFTLSQRMDVYPGESELLDIAARFDNEPECYGWSNESYFSNPPWRTAAWRLQAGRYLVKVTILSAGERCAGIFRVINDVAQQDFRMEHTLDEDSVRD